MNRLLKPFLTAFLIFFFSMATQAVITIYSADPEVASRTYAIILNGGIDRDNNYSGYYIHCSWIYRVLHDGYGIPKSHIWAVMADGTDPEYDYTDSKGKPRSSNPDLDGDGEDEIRYSATRVNVKKTIDEIASQIRKNDNLFIFVADHGHTDSEDIDISTICLWNKEELYDYELSEWLSPVFDKGATVCMLLGQCYSGGFLDNFTRPGCVVMAAAPKGVPGTSTVIDKDENILVDLLYYWTAAITGTDEEGYKKDAYSAADLDEDGVVTMEEAFRYAWGKMGKFPMSEVYRATPPGMGDLAFNRFPTGPDIYIRDNMTDTGHEPNSSTDIAWDSPDIWVRNEPDDRTYHQNPYLTPDHTAASVYVRVHNRSPRAYPADGGEYLHCYWTRASTSATPADWKGEGENGGGTVGSAPIPALAPGDSAVIRLDWILPEVLSGNMTSTGAPRHLSLQAEITSDPKPKPTKGKGDDKFTDPLSSRRIARKTLSVIDSRDISRGASVMVRDVSTGSYGLEVRERPRTGKKGILSKAEVILSIPATVEKARVPASGSDDHLNDTLLLATPPGLVTVTLRPKGLLVTDTYWKDCPYTFDLIQHDATGKIVGGAAFTVDHGMTATLPIDSLVVGRSVTLTADIPEETTDGTTAGSPLTYWLDTEGNTVGTGRSVTVRPTRGSDSFTAVSVTPGGRVSTGSVSLAPRTGIREVRTDAAGRPGTVELLEAEDSDGAMIRIVSLTHPEIVPADTAVPRGATTVRLNPATLPAGICSVAYITRGRTADELRIHLK